MNRSDEPQPPNFGDDAFRALVDAHRAELLRYARRCLGSRSEIAEDVLQESFLKAYRRLAAGDEPQNTRAWLFAIVRNTAIDAARQAPGALPLDSHHGAATGPTPLEAIEQSEWIEWLMGAIGTLPVRQREALVGHALEGRSYRELATSSKTTVSAIKTLIHRARRGLADGSALHALGAPFLFLSRRLAGFSANRAIAGKLSANGLAGVLAAAVGTATITSGLLFAVHGGPSAAIAAPGRHLSKAHVVSYRRPHTGGVRAPAPAASPVVRLHREARRATSECDRGKHLDRKLRSAALRYAASHLNTSLMEYTECGRILRDRATQITWGHRHPHGAPAQKRRRPVHRATAR